MVFIHNAPQWFSSCDIGLELVMAFVSLFVAIFAFKLYKKTYQASVQLLGGAFLSISGSYFIQSIIHVAGFLHGLCEIAHIVFMTLGLSLLFYATVRTRNFVPYIALFSVSMLAIFMAKNMTFAFYAVASLYLFFLVIHATSNYMMHRKALVLLIVIAYVLLFISNLHFLIASHHHYCYVVARLFEAAAYLLILVNLILVQR